MMRPGAVSGATRALRCLCVGCCPRIRRYGRCSRSGHLLDSKGGIRESIGSHGHVAWIFNPSRGPHSGFYSKAPLGDHYPLAAWPSYYP
eukprot:26616-Prymnesium_polylepis.1